MSARQHVRRGGVVAALAIGVVVGTVLGVALPATAADGQLPDAAARLLATLKQVDDQVAELDVRATKTEQLLRASEQRASAAESTALRASDELHRAEAQLRGIIELLAAQPKHAGLRALIGADSSTDVVMRNATLAQLADAHARSYAQVESLRTEAAQAAEAARASHDDLLALYQQLSTELAALSSQRAAQHTALEALRKDRAALAAAQREAALARDRIVASGNAPAAASAHAGALSLRLPVVGPIVQRFGEVNRQGADDVRSQGIRVRAPIGTTVVAPAAGKVVHVGTLRLFGRVVVIAHDGGFHSILGQLSGISVDVGDVVAAGQDVARVAADDGDAAVGAANAYFELRKNGQPTDPLRMLGH